MNNRVDRCCLPLEDGRILIFFMFCILYREGDGTKPGLDASAQPLVGSPVE